jgi:TolB protein
LTEITEDPEEQKALRGTLSLGQRSEVWMAGRDGGPAELVYSTNAVRLEAPNVAADGKGLLLNGGGLLWRLDLEPVIELRKVPIDHLPPINNDHVVDAARDLIYLSANDGQIYVVPTTGGTARPVTDDPGQFHFLHGVSPDGTTLACVVLTLETLAGPGRLAFVRSDGGKTRYPSAGRSHLDGPEFSQDGAWIYFNTEEFAQRPGHAQLARMPARGGSLERLVVSDSVDWFPHLSPDGELAVYISFPRGTLGHPADLHVEVRLVRTEDWARPIGRFPLFGGQGTINVNSWSPDSRRFSFVAHPIQ